MVKAIIYALSAAALYAVNTPVSKLLLDKIPPAFMAAFLYLGAGMGVGIMYLLRKNREEQQLRLEKADLIYTVGMIVLDIAAPILLMFGIKLGSASNAALLGNFEIVATTLIALLFFRETVTKQLWLAIVLITASSALLTFEGESSFRFSCGSLLVLLAAVCWGLENNCTRKIADKSTYEIVTLKGLFSGAGSLVIALVTGEKLPEPGYITTALLLGFAAYGLSIFLYIRAQRTLGAAKTSAYYAVAPFIGAFLSFLLVGERMTGTYFAALIIMLAGSAFVVWDTIHRHHTHEHTHVIVHAHGGAVHTHTITHSHPHDHYSENGQHRNHHRRSELEKECTHKNG